MLMISVAVFAALVASVAAFTKGAGQCSTQCNDLRLEVLTLKICQEAKRQLPRPKVGDYCSTAMEQGFSDACMALCMEQPSVSRVAQACRSAAMEMPRPTVRKWCEHGYSTAFSKTRKDLATHFAVTEPVVESAPEIKAVPVEPVKAVEVEPVKEAAPILTTIPLTLDDVNYDLEVHQGESAEDALILFCQKHAADDTAGCIRHLLPVVLERLEDGTM